MTESDDPLGRDLLLDYLRKQLIGPVGGLYEELSDAPTGRYAVGALHAQQVSSEDGHDGQEVDDRGGGATERGQQGPPDDPVALASQWMPSSVGLSFLVRGGGIEVDLAAAIYEQQGGSTSVPVDDASADELIAGDGGAVAAVESAKGPRRWVRVPLAERDFPVVQTVLPPENGRVVDLEVFDGRARLVSIWRPVLDGHLVTVTLVNNSEPGPKSTVDRVLRALFQVHVRCRPHGDGQIDDYPSARLIAIDEEEQELELQYRHLRHFGVGHGCAVAWGLPTEQGVAWVETSWIPVHETPNLLPARSSLEALRVRRLADADDPKNLAADLTQLNDSYREWLAEISEGLKVPPALEPARDRVLGRILEASDRMQHGIELLARDPVALRAFRFANAALFESMRRGRGVSGSPRKRDQGSCDDVVDAGSDPAWHPFQLAFQLCVLPSLVEEGHPHRDVVDLLWFPTGGGKTEAYLGLAAMAIFLRRLSGAGAGTTVLTRYTLRLLTTQQFQRAATLVTACELVRRDNQADLGDRPISLGLWVGQAATPNKCADARDRLIELLEEDFPASPFTLDVCPWCATQLVPERRTENSLDYGFDGSAANDFRMFCPSQDCPFHERLPVQVVDEAIYADPPDFVVATVDKFAQLAFKPESGRLLGVGVDGGGPSLVIQDELHLLSGPLGTMVGLYEAAIQEVIRHVGGRPKIVASTATIRRAAEQARGLFGRDVRVFPPPGVRYGDSYFARIDEKSPGRLYAGVMSQAHTPSFTVVQSAAALMQGREEIDLTDAERDSYGTLVAYHNSLRELGKVVTFARDDIPSRMAFYASSKEVRREMSADGVVELTSNVGDRELTRTLARLAAPAGSSNGVDFVASTNMLSVGVDVPRLGLMLVNGQPKTTAEYIQATSRVGRGGVPGLVVTLYSPAKPRDRSHYEQFGNYHQSIYRWVEPTSVTPFALPARNRALHAALVILARHVLGLPDQADAAKFTVDLPGLAEAIDGFVAHVAHVDPDEAASTRRDLESLVDEWAERAESSGERLRYRVYSRDFENLLIDFGEMREGWPTPNSMRNVDRECLLQVAGAN